MSIFESAVETMHVLTWLDEVEKDPLGYYKVEFADNDSGRFASLMLSPSYVSSYGLDVSSETFEIAENKLILNMLVDGLIEQGEAATGTNWRLKLLGWYRSLSSEQKLTLPIFGNQLSMKRGLKLVPELASIQSAMSAYPTVRRAYDEINDDLQKLGVISDTYQTVHERIDSKEKFEPVEHGLVDFKRLKALPLDCTDDYERPGPGRPFQSIKHAFASASLKAASDSGLSNYLETFKWVAKFFVELGLTGMESIGDILDPFVLPRFRSHLEQRVITGDLSPNHANTLMSSFRKTLGTVSSVKGYDGSSFINSPGFDANRVTDTYRPYSVDERLRISQSVDEDILLNNRLAQPYVQSGVGVDPVGTDGLLKHGQGTLENARWIFENKFGCSSLGFTADESDPYVRAYLSILTRADIGIRDVMQSWGVHHIVDSAVITPYIVKLAQITGLNADSLRLMNLDDYVKEHELTLRPCLRYWKERSDGGKVMHLDLFDAEITWLTTSQSKEVAKIFEEVKFLTAGIRKNAPAEAKKRLFIWESSAPASYRKIKALSTSKMAVMSVLFGAYAKRKGLLDDSGVPLSLSASRLRPSFISELVERDVTIREIQLILGHKHVETTMAYLDRMDFNAMARAKLTVALSQVHESAIEPDMHKRHVAPEKKVELIEAVNVGAPRVVFKTPLASCANIMNPPEFVKKLSTYVPGSPCSMYNMCLGCANVMLTASDLPQLFAMERDYLKLAEVSRIMDTPYGRVVRENLTLLNKILSEKTSEFSLEELAEGRRLAEFVDTTILVDGVGL